MNFSFYRPILLLFSFSKIFEKIVYKRVYSYLLKFKLFSPNQFGFQCDVSTFHVMSAVYDDLLNNTDKKYYSCCLFLDLSKAFDTVDHNIVACRASLFIKLPCQTSFCLFLHFFLLVCFRLLCVILVFTMCIRVLLLYASKITHTYFYFFIWARLCLFLFSLGSSVIGLPFPPLGCLSIIFC